VYGIQKVQLDKINDPVISQIGTWASLITSWLFYQYVFLFDSSWNYCFHALGCMCPEHGSTVAVSS